MTAAASARTVDAAGPLDDWLCDRREQREKAGLRRRLRCLPGGCVDLASNDYLGLSRDPRVVAAARAALEEFGTGSRASRLVTGTLGIHEWLERELRALTGQPAALAFSSGYAANTGVLTALGDADTLIVSDTHAHASLVDGARLSRSPVRIARHSDVAHVAELLAERSETRAIVVVESVYSVWGDHAPLRELAETCKRQNALLLVDEAHGIGVAGGGRGLVHELGLAGSPHVALTLTLSKALGAQGGAVLGSPALREHLVNTARPFIFDTALAPTSAAAATEAARIIGEAPELAARLHERARFVASALNIPHARAAVQSVPMVTPEFAVRAAEQLRARGVAVGCFRPPSVPDGISRLRITAPGNMELQELSGALDHVREVLADVSGGDPVTP
ncbi:8-amino-7-oxononanoate synthase [Kocuria rhizophila]|uniref:8-amino-7-oxononanoate synthase n=1 Tax=Kocuria rhizophila TaxID=72000 RepID=A0AAX2SCZ3_KOCRH|nr:8-amino-7-oxononanoate synthase [Kocuria rhizophila]TFI00641.1 8-amino-7-oxononanoate synthase [Kocuria rhizophila]TFI11861.1 8-amino-7-oxononanoate synthase [Kocuria rhizophila]